MTLLLLPQEILSQIFSYLPPADIVHIGQTCRLAHGFIVPENKLLWQAAFTQIFDSPQQAWSSIPKTIRPNHILDVEKRWNWYHELKRRCLALKAIHPRTIGDFDQKEFSAEDVAQTLLEIIDTAKSRPTDAEIARGAVPQIDDRSSLNISLLTSTQDPWGRLENFIHDSHTPVDNGDDDDVPSYLIGRPITRSISLQKRLGSRTEHQSRLHVLYGRTAREKLEHGSKGRARRIVYNWNHPVAENDYGPFKPDGSGEVNWTVLEGVMSVITRNFEMCVDGRIAMPPGFCYSIPYRTLTNPNVPEDWANVTGSWLGTYSFLDYADLFHFNTWNDVSTVPTLEDVPEACGDLMRLELKLNPSLAADPKLQSTLPRCEEYPTLYFSGPSKSYDPFGHPRMQISFRGCVSLCPGGREVRWRYIINYRGHDQWQLEGVQPGGIRSGPVYGTWTQWGHEEFAPVGSFMYVQEELCKKQELVLSRRRRDSS